jgi:hypothetical protein
VRLDETIMPSLNVGGRGGKEKMLAPAFPDYIFVNEPLYDFQHREDPTDILEVKKQANCQWFDIGKYHNLSPTQRKIKMTFILHEGGGIQSVFHIPLGDMLDLLCSDPAYRKHGWTQENIEECAVLKRKFPSMQVKVKLAVKTFYKKHQNCVTTVYSSVDI